MIYLCQSSNMIYFFSSFMFQAWTLWKEQNAFQLIDSSIKGSCVIPKVLRCTNVYLRKTLGKTNSGSTNIENKRFESCFYTQGRYQHPMRQSQGTTVFNQICEIVTFNLFLFSLFYVFLIFWGRQKRGFCSYVSSIAVSNSDLRSSLRK